jgi:hypothetical protein
VTEEPSVTEEPTPRRRELVPPDAVVKWATIVSATASVLALLSRLL